MASSTLFSFRAPLSVRTQATSNGGTEHRAAAAKARSPKWWAPLFGIPEDPDYIDGNTTSRAAPAARRRFGGLTEQKAKELRKKMMETETYHDAMYHSAIASRLASDMSRD